MKKLIGIYNTKEMTTEQIWKAYQKYKAHGSNNNKWYYEIMNKKFFQLIANYSSALWLISIIGFLLVLSVATKFMTYDPTFGAGESENWLLLPMLASGGVGLLSFTVLIIAIIVSHFLKGEQVKSLAPTKIFSLISVFLIFGAITFMFGFRQAGLRTISFTGDEAFNAINNYRVLNGMEVLKLDPIICDNLVQRWIDISSSDTAGHNGSEEWAKAEGLDTKYTMAEVYMKNVTTPDDAITWWNGSPGHRTALLGDYSVGCAYANDGTVVAVFGRPL